MTASQRSGNHDSAASAVNALEPLAEKPALDSIVEIPLESGIVGLFHSFRGLPDKWEHFAVALGPVKGANTPLVRIHSECITGDVFGSQKCDCGAQLKEALYRLHQEGGYLLYLRQEGRGIGLYAKLKSYNLQMQGLDTYEANRQLRYGADQRDYRVASEMLKAMGVTRVRLISNNPDKAEQLQHWGVSIEERIPTGVYVGPHNKRYLQEKALIAHHSIQL